MTTFWLDEPCPAWCTITHKDDDLPDDRFHHGAIGDFVRRTLAPSTDGRPATIGVYLRRHVREVAPEVIVWSEVEDVEFHLTIGETSDLGAALSLAVESTKEA